jgi:hypothetical protein
VRIHLAANTDPVHVKLHSCQLDEVACTGIGASDSLSHRVDEAYCTCSAHDFAFKTRSRDGEKKIVPGLGLRPSQ